MKPLQVRLDSRLLVRAPGERLEALAALATWRAKTGMSRRTVSEARYYPEHDVLRLPRGLWPLPEALGPFAEPEDARIVHPPLRFRWRGPETLEPSQERAARAVYRAGGGLLVAPGGWGKTIVSLRVLGAWRQPALWIVHSTGLAQQALEAARELFDLPESAFGLLTDGERDRIGTHLTVGTRQTILGIRDQAFRLRFGTLWVDEVDAAAARTYMRLAQWFAALHRGGCTATLKRSDGLDPAVVAVFGPVVATVTEREAAAEGRFVLPAVRWVRTRRRYTWRGNWPDMQWEHALDPVRNRLIAGQVAADVRAGHSVVVLVQLLDHAAALRDLLRGLGVEVRILTGEVDGQVRRRRLAAAVGRTLRCVVATRVLDRGVNVPAWDRLHLADGYRSDPTSQQQVYRLTRPEAGKGEPLVIDYWDGGLQYGGQAWARRRFYARQGYRQEGDLPPKVVRKHR